MSEELFLYGAEGGVASCKMKNDQEFESFEFHLSTKEVNGE